MVAANAVVGLSKAWHAAVVAHKESLARLGVLGVLAVLNHKSLVDTFIVMAENARNIESVGARHTILAGVARHHRERRVKVGYLRKQVQIVVRQRFERRVCPDIVLKVFHIGHSAQNRQNARLRPCETERPRSHAGIGLALFEKGCGVVVQVGQPSAQKRFHHQNRNVAFLEFGVGVFRILVHRVHLRGVLPIDVIVLNQNEIPMVGVIQSEKIVEALAVAVERES